MSLEAHYFDGRSSRRQSVRLSAGDACLLLESPDGARAIGSIAIADIRVSEPQGHAPRTLRFADSSAFCEVAQGPALDALLAALGYHDTITVQLQNHWRWAFVSLAGIAMILAAGYFWGLPWVAKVAAPFVPVTAMRTLSDKALEQLDKHLLKPSQLPEERKQKLRNAFQTLSRADALLAPYGAGLFLDFRSAPRIGPNAFALPGGQVILLDELVKLCNDDDELLAVLAHELGHLNGRHTTRLLIQSSAVATATAAWFGDVSYALTAVSAALLNSNYSRDMEREADFYASLMLRRQGKSPALLANALERMDVFYRAKRDKANKDGDAKKQAENYLDWLSSHPGTDERIRRLREEQDNLK